MASAPTDFGGNYLLAVLFGLVTPPSGYWLALISGDPGTDTDGDILVDAEPDGAGYGRQFIASGSSNWTITGQFLTNVITVPYGVAPADWGLLDHYALCTDQHSGEVYGYGELANPQTVVADQAVIIPPGGIMLALVNVDTPIAL